jgi:hypothetical protein
VPLPSFRAYLRVIRAKPGFWFAVVGVLAITTRNAMAEGIEPALLYVSIGVAIGVAVFPWWRRRAVHSPFQYSNGHPELLQDATSEQAHPAEPQSNVHRLD